MYKRQEQIYLGMDDPNFGIQHTGRNGKSPNCCLTHVTLYSYNNRSYMCFSFSSMLVKAIGLKMSGKAGFKPRIGMAGSQKDVRSE